MLYPILPIFLTQVLHASGSVVGVVEGIAEATQNLVQGFSGWLSDKLQSAPRAIYSPDPEYSDEARHANIQGTSVIALTVGTDGQAHDVRLVRGLGHGLDENAIEAVKTWRFEPTIKDGKPVAVSIKAEISFRLGTD
jgi:TonB family protein